MILLPVVVLLSLAVTRVASLSSSSSQQQPRANNGLDPSRERRQESLNVGYHPLLSLNINLDALARANAPERAQELYHRISALYSEGYYAVAPDVVSFNSVLKAWQNEPDRALEFWEQEFGSDDDEEKASREGEGAAGGDGSGADAASYAPHRQRQSSSLLQPNVRSYNTFLLALARAGLHQQAKILLRQMQDEQSVVLPDRITYNTVLLAHCCCAPVPGSNNSKSKKESAAAAQRATDILHEMLQPESCVKPDVISYNTVLSAWAGVGTRFADQKANDLLNEMLSEVSEVRPDTYSYTTVIHAWSRRSGSSKKALNLLRSMQQQQRDDAQVQPNKVTYTNVMLALLRDRKLEDARRLLDEMIELSAESHQLRPDVVAFSALLDGYADQADRHKNPRQLIRMVLEVLEQMKAMARDNPDVAPNQLTYTSAMSALARSRQWEAGPLAEQLLEEMYETGVTPSIIHWNTVLNAYAKSPRANKIHHANRIWDKIAAQQHVAPDVITYNTMLSVAANSFASDGFISRKACLQMGFDVFRALQRDPDCQASSLTFHYLFKIIRKFMPLESIETTTRRWDIIRRIFQLCCEQGCVNEHILEQIVDNMGLKEEEVDILLGSCKQQWASSSSESRVSLSSLPAEWSQNALRSSRKVTRQPPPQRT